MYLATTRNIFSLCLISTFYLLSGFSQEEIVVNKSSQKILLNGKVYYLHTVKQGQTLYSISKAYGVSQDDILDANPEIENNIIKIGNAIKIPAEVKIPKDPEPPPLQDNANYYYHKVTPGETIYFLSKKYNVSPDIIFTYNPSAREGISKGSILTIPKKSERKQVSNKAYDTKEPQWENYYVNSTDSLYLVAEKHQVPVHVIIADNPFLRYGIRTGMVLKIRNNYYEPFDTASQTSLTNIPFLNTPCVEVEAYKKLIPIKVALLLPFYSDILEEEGVEEMNPDSIITLEEKKHITSIRRKRAEGDNFYEFYSGALLAIDTLKKQNVNIELFVFDTKNDTNEVDQIILKLKDIRPDIIIGPAYTENVKRVADFGAAHQIHVISPLASNLDILSNNPYVWQVVPSNDIELKVFTEFIAKNKDANIILIHNEHPLMPEKVDQFRECLFANIIMDKNYSGSVYNEVNYNDTINSFLNATLSPTKKNIVVILSESEAIVSNILSVLDMYIDKFEIELIGYPSWQKFQNVQIEYYHNQRLCYYSPFYIDYNDEVTKQFILKFRNSYGYEPYKISSKGYNFAFLGYDLLYYFIQARYTYGPSFDACTQGMENDGFLLSTYQFRRNNYFGGMENNSLTFIRFDRSYTVGPERFAVKNIFHWEDIPENIEFIEFSVESIPDDHTGQ